VAFVTALTLGAGRTVAAPTAPTTAATAPRAFRFLCAGLRFLTAFAGSLHAARRAGRRRFLRGLRRARLRLLRLCLLRVGLLRVSRWWWGGSTGLLCAQQRGEGPGNETEQREVAHEGHRGEPTNPRCGRAGCARHRGER